jgi:hydrogenase expression/formation protein HypE
MAGARPLYLTAGFIIEEGLPVGTLDRIIESMARAAEAAGVSIVAGDTKVVDRGKGDGVFINTAGVGVVGPGVELGPARMEPGDVLMLTGALGRHGVAVMGERNGLTFDPPVTSDTANLARLTGAMLDAAGGGLRVMRDPTRGGLATTLKEFALESGLCMVLDEDALPVPDGVRGACGLLGLDPLYVANEGLCVAALAPDVAEYVLERARQTPEGSGACLVGRVAAGPARAVLLSTSLGGTRVLDMLEGEQLPRIC